MTPHGPGAEQSSCTALDVLDNKVVINANDNELMKYDARMSVWREMVKYGTTTSISFLGFLSWIAYLILW